jgi:hypothetical protein
VIEKVFAIDAEPGVVWDALWADLSSGDEAAFEVVEAHRPNDLAIEVRLSGVPAFLRYTIASAEMGSEITALLVPRGLRYSVSRLITFNHFNRNFELMLVQGLANLKTSVEGRTLAAPTEETEL